MEELKLLVGMVADLPNMALWVIAFFFVYKVVVVGSIYSTIKFTVAKFHDWMIFRKTPPEKIEVKLEDYLHGIVIRSDDTMNQLISQIRRLAGKNTNISSKFIHECSVDWLREAINAKEKADIESEPK